MKTTLRASLVIAIVAVSALFARASEEDYLPWRSIRIDCLENRETGKVRVSVQAKDDGILALTIEAFGRSYSPSKADLLKIKDYPLDSLRVTHEAGYAQTGGHTVHVKFRRTSYDGEKKPITEEAYVSVSKEKGLSVSTRIKTR